MTHKLNKEQKSEIAADIKEIEARINDLKEAIKTSGIAIDIGAEYFANPLVDAKQRAMQIKSSAESIIIILDNILKNCR